MQIKQIATAVAVLATSAFCVLGVPVYERGFQPSMGGTQLNTRVAVLDSKGALGEFAGADEQAAMTVVDPSKLLEEAPRVEDVQEDPIDPFITSASGKPRALLMDDEDEFADESPLASERGHALTRVKRCNGGGGGGGGGGNANRARARRRARSSRRTNRSRNRSNQGGTTTTTTVRRVIHQVAPGQVVVPAQPVVQSAGPQQSVIVHHQPAQQVVVQQPAGQS